MHFVGKESTVTAVRIHKERDREIKHTNKLKSNKLVKGTHALKLWYLSNTMNIAVLMGNIITDVKTIFIRQQPKKLLCGI